MRYLEAIDTGDRSIPTKLVIVDNFTSWRSGISPRQMREIDRLAEEEYGLTPALLMEVAGLAAARVARIILGPSTAGRSISILAGPGNNGADGLVAARRLCGWGAEVAVLTSYNIDSARGLSETQLELATAAGVSVEAWQGAMLGADLVIDALLGFGALGDPRGNVAGMIDAATRSRRPILALDVPSGLDPETGLPSSTCVEAAATVTLGLAKTGLLTDAARPFVGRLFLADIGLPRPLLARLGVDCEGLFEGDDIVELS